MKVETSLKTNKKSNKSKAQNSIPTLNKQSKLGKDIIHPILTFGITVLMFMILLVIFDLAPLGNTPLLISDLKAQYAPYLILYKNHIRELDFGNLISSFTYSNVIACGKNFMSTFGYYMASPMNWIVFLFEDSNIDVAVVTIMGMKISLGATFMCMFLRKRAENKESIWPMIMGVTYAFTSFAIAFLFSIIWLDGYAILPLLLFFIEKFIEERKKAGIVVALLWLFVSNLYISYMVGAFSFCYLMARLIYMGAIEKKIDIKTISKTAVRFILIAICCILVLGIFILPVGMDILGNRDILQESRELSAVQFKAIDIFDQFFLGNLGDFNETMSYNMPYIFSSVLVTLMIVTFFVTSAVKKADKYFYGIVLVLIYVSFNIRFIDIAWQAFDNPNWFCHRYSFVFFPVFYLIALRGMEKLKEISRKEILYSAGITLVMLIIAQSFGKMGSDGTIFLINVGLIGGYALLLLGVKREKWHELVKNMQKICIFLVALLLIVESSCFNSMFSGTLSSYISSGNSDNFSNEIKSLQTAVSVINGTPYYRIGFEPSYEEREEDIELYHENETGMYGNFRSINLFDSSSNKSYGRFIKQLGHMSTFNYFLSSYNYAAAPTDAFFGMPFVFTHENVYSGNLVNVVTTGDSQVFMYMNQDVLPIGFAADKTAKTFDFYQLERKEFNKDYFKFQNEWYKSMFGEEFTEDFYNSHRVNSDDIVIYNATKAPVNLVDIDLKPLTSVDPTSSDSNSKDFQKRNTLVRQSSGMPIILEINYVVQESGEQYFSVVADRLLDEMTICKNKEIIEYINPGTYYSRIFRLGYYEAGETITMVVKSENDVFSYQDFFFASIDNDKFYEQLAEVDKSKVKATTYENGHVVFATNLDEDEMLLTTMPYENGWTCYVDGAETEIIPYQNAFIAVDCGSGTHNVELKFEAPGMKTGLIVSCVGVVAMIALFVFDKVDKKKKK